MANIRLPLLAAGLLATALATHALAAGTTTLCNPSVVGETTVANTAQTVAAGKRVMPPSLVGPTGFDWNDTELGVIPGADGSNVLFLASDGSCHRACNRPQERDGSITVTQGTLDNPLGTGSPAESIIGMSGVTLPPSMLYAGGGAAYRVPSGRPAAGTILLVYQAARASYTAGHRYPDCNAKGYCNGDQNGFYSYLGLAASRDDGHTWRNFGLIVAVNQPYNPQLTVDIGNGNLIADPPAGPGAPQYFRIYFPDRLKTPGVPGGNGTRLSVARAPYAALLQAVATDATLPAFHKYFDGAWNEPGIGGVSTDIGSNMSSLDGDMFVAWDSWLNRYVGIFDNTQTIKYIESADGLSWSGPVTLPAALNPRTDTPRYATPVGTGANPAVLGEDFYVYYNFQRFYGANNGWASTQLRACTSLVQAAPLAAPRSRTEGRSFATAWGRAMLARVRWP